MKNACLLEDKTRKTACNVRSWLYVREESGVTCQLPPPPPPLLRSPITHPPLTLPPRGCPLVASLPTTIPRPALAPSASPAWLRACRFATNTAFVARLSGARGQSLRCACQSDP